jgi:hypothetical protein
MFRLSDKNESRLYLPYVETLLVFDLEKGFIRFLGHYYPEKVLPHRVILKVLSTQEILIDILSYTETHVINAEEENNIEFTPLNNIQMYFKTV